MIFANYSSSIMGQKLIEKAKDFDWRKLGFRELSHSPFGKDFLIRGQYGTAQFDYENKSTPVKIRSPDKRGLEEIFKLLTRDFEIKLTEVSRSESPYKR